jgi:hypothetical protein
MQSMGKLCIKFPKKEATTILNVIASCRIPIILLQTNHTHFV